MYSVLLRTTIMFIIVMFAVRLMGKKNLGEFRPGDFVSTMLISNLTSIAIEAPELPLLYSAIPILLISCYEVFISVTARKSRFVADITRGKSMILIKKGVIDQKVMADLRLTAEDVLEVMRSKDIFYLEQISLAIVETTGKVSIYPNPEFEKEGLKAPMPPLPVVLDGKKINENINRLELEDKYIEKILSDNKIKFNDVLLLLTDGNRKHNLVLKEKR